MACMQMVEVIMQFELCVYFCDIMCIGNVIPAQHDLLRGMESFQRDNNCVCNNNCMPASSKFVYGREFWTTIYLMQLLHYLLL